MKQLSKRSRRLGACVTWRTRWSMVVMLLAMLAVSMVPTAGVMAQGGNPLDRPRQPAEVFPRYFEGDGLIMAIERRDAATGQVVGRLMLGDDIFAFTGERASNDAIRGTFRAGENDYPFTATPGENDTFRFSTGGANYNLAKVDRPSRALPGTPESRNPLRDRPDATGTGENGAAPMETLQQAVDAWGRNDMVAVMRVLRPLADRGHLGASYLTGLLLADGAEGVEQDPKAALRYIEHAANHKHPGALFTLGEMYFWGHGTEQNEQRGLDAITAAAKLGEPAAMANLGTFLYDGTTVTENVTDGLAWLLIAEKREDPFARDTVGRMKNDRNITQEDWDRAAKRVPEIEAQIARGPVPDYLLGFNRSEPIEERARPTNASETSADTLAGRWTGTATEQFADGTTGRYPVVLTLASAANGSYSGDFSFETTATLNDNQQVTIRGRAQMRGAKEGNQLVLRTDDLTLTIVQTNQQHPLGAQLMTLESSGNRLTGRIGNDEIGWTNLTLEREAGAPPRGGGILGGGAGTGGTGGAGGGGGPEREVARPTLAGTWAGSGRDEAEDGTPLTFPVTITLAEGSAGSYTAQLHSTMQYPVGQGQTVQVDIRGTFTGRANSAGLIEMRSRDITASANGQTEPMGEVGLRLRPTGENRMSGQVGTDIDGWTEITLERRGGVPSNQGGAGNSNPPRGGGMNTNTGGGAAAANLPQTISFHKVTLRDPGMDNMVSHTLLVPKGWEVKGGQQWNPQAFRDAVHLNLRISSGDGHELAVYPGGMYEDSDIYEIGAQMGAQNARPRPGQVLSNGITHMPVPQSVAQYVTQILMPMNRPQARNMRVISVTQLDDLRRQLEEVLAPVRQNMERNDQQLRQMGAQYQSTLTSLAERVRISYEEGGRAFEEDVWVLGSVTHTRQQMSGMPATQTWNWGIIDPRGVRAPAGQLDASRPLIEAISLSITPEPRYQALLMHIQHKINMQQLDAIAKRGEIARQGREEAWQIYQSTVQERQASNDRMNEQFNDYIQDVGPYQDLDGSKIKLPSLYSNVYSNGNGEYILTNEPTFDPNDQPHSTVRWERINPTNYR